jgi:hypothetical protein
MGPSVSFGTAATVDDSDPPRTGERVRVSRGAAGAHFVATVHATVHFSDGTDCGSEACGPSPCTPPGQLGQVEIFQSPVSLPAERTRYALGSSHDWSVAGAGTEVPMTEQPLGGPVAADGAILHQLGLLILDSDPAGSYSSRVSYTATVP